MSLVLPLKSWYVTWLNLPAGHLLSGFFHLSVRTERVRRSAMLGRGIYGLHSFMKHRHCSPSRWERRRLPTLTFFARTGYLQVSSESLPPCRTVRRRQNILFYTFRDFLECKQSLPRKWELVVNTMNYHPADVMDRIVWYRKVPRSVRTEHIYCEGTKQIHVPALHFSAREASPCLSTDLLKSPELRQLSVMVCKGYMPLRTIVVILVTSGGPWKSKALVSSWATLLWKGKHRPAKIGCLQFQFDRDIKFRTIDSLTHEKQWQHSPFYLYIIWWERISILGVALLKQNMLALHHHFTVHFFDKHMNERRRDRTFHGHTIRRTMTSLLTVKFRGHDKDTLALPDRNYWTTTQASSATTQSHKIERT